MDYVTGIIVTFNPDIEQLNKLIEATAPQVQRLLIVDNGSHIELTSILVERENTELIALGENFGIAKAQNIGIKYAKTIGTDYVLLLDQDSIPALDMVATLVAAANTKHSQGIKLACVGPRYDDPRQEIPVPFIQIKDYRMIRQTCETNECLVEVDYLIASGCLIPLETIKNVGVMREELFIDYVDIEWGLRAQESGYQSFGVCAASMQHQLGDEPVYFRGRHIPVHNPLRHYYHFRNAVWLYRQDWLRRNWKVVDGLRLVRKFVFYSLMTPPRLQHFKMMSLGIWHGLTGQMGKLDR
ncbi:glycosyltransferase family 2 protein [Brucella tritici]|uniref:glycosyltransferase family 2 protein n=1 Tax=Brucella tritici TaxID=94626 RepID=UPI00158FB5C8|nr:glycosyltransferase family 2 protein [Brucella tritici]